MNYVMLMVSYKCLKYIIISENCVHGDSGKECMISNKFG